MNVGWVERSETQQYRIFGCWFMPPARYAVSAAMSVRALRSITPQS